MITLRLGLREALNNWRFSLFFMLNLFLGLSGFIALDAFQKATQATLAQESKSILGADFAIYARRPLSTSENETITRTLSEEFPEVSLDQSRAIEMYSMAASASQSRLVQLKAVDGFFPFYGKLQLRSGLAAGQGEMTALQENPVIWVYPEILQQLQVAVGDSIRLGTTDFRIADVIEKDPSASAMGVSLAPRIYLSLRALKSTSLLGVGSTAYYHTLYRLPAAQWLRPLLKSLNEKLTDPAIRIESHEDAGADLARLSGIVGDFLGLVALVAYCLTALGCSFLFFDFLNRRMRDIAILLSLGASPFKARLTYLVQLVLLGSSAALPTVVAALALFPWLNHFNARFFPLPLTLTLNPSSFFLAMAFGTLGSLLLGLPILARVSSVKPVSLLAENFYYEKNRFDWRPVGWALPALVTFWLMAVWQAHSWVNGSWFAGGFLFSAFILALLGLGFLKTLQHISEKYFVKFLALRLALRQLYRNRLSSLACFLAMALGSVLLNLLPQIHQTLAQEFERPDRAKLPSLFLFDIQPEQMNALEQALAKHHLQLNQASPLIRARLETVNNKPFVKGSIDTPLTREEEREQRFRNRGFNLTVRDQLTESEQIFSGEPFAPHANAAPDTAQISIERRFAERLGLRLGDRLTFDVQGISVSGVIVNLRKVRWTSFQPNFFVVFESGFLDDAPKTYLASLPAMPLDQRGMLQNELVKSFPNVSIIDVSRVVNTTLELIGHISQAIGFMAILAIAAGLVVLFSITRLQAFSRRYELNLLKILGGDFSLLTRLFLLEAGILMGAAGILGGVFGLGFSYALSRLLFDDLWIFNPWVPLRTTLLMLLLGLAVARLAVGRVLQDRPLILLSAAAA